MLSVLTTHTQNNNNYNHKESLGGVGYVCYFDCNDGIMSACKIGRAHV